MKPPFFPSQGLGAGKSSLAGEGSLAKALARKGRSRRREARMRLVDQMSRWGRDVTDPSGNLLVRHGFIARKHPDLGGSSVYSRAWRDRRIELHSQWVGIGGGGRPGMIFVRPLGCIRILPAELPEVPFGLLPSVVSSGADRNAEGPSVDQALSEFLAWLDTYESWATVLRSSPASSRTDSNNSFAGSGTRSRDPVPHINPVD